MTTAAGSARTERISIVPFVPELLPAVRAFSRQRWYWHRPRNAAYYEWRYLQSRPFSRMFLALRGDECVAMVFALRKQYRIDGLVTPCLEVFDWHSLPELRGSGLGIRLMRAMMKEPGWIVSLGGTDQVSSCLALMGWQVAGTTRLYDLALTNERRTALLAGASSAPQGRGWMYALSAARVRASHRPPGGVVTRSRVPGPEVLGLYESSSYGIVQQPEPEILAWMAGNRWSGHYEALTFTVDGRTRGWALTRLYDWGFGLDGDLIDVYADRPDPGLYGWMVAEALKSLLDAAPRRVRARTSCPALRAALLAHGFDTLGPEVPINVRPAGGTWRRGSVHFTLNHADGPLLPYGNGARLDAVRPGADPSSGPAARSPFATPSR